MERNSPGALSSTRAWRLRLHWHIGSSCDSLELLALHHARLLCRSGAAAFGRSTAASAAAPLTMRPPAAPAPPAPLQPFSACLSVAVTLQAMRVCSLAEVLRPSAAAEGRSTSGGATSGRTGASGAFQRGLRPHCDSAESGFIGRRRRLGRALYPPTDTGFE